MAVLTRAGAKRAQDDLPRASPQPTAARNTSTIGKRKFICKLKMATRGRSAPDIAIDDSEDWVTTASSCSTSVPSPHASLKAHHIALPPMKEKRKLDHDLPPKLPHKSTQHVKNTPLKVAKPNTTTTTSKPNPPTPLKPQHKPLLPSPSHPPLPAPYTHTPLSAAFIPSNLSYPTYLTHLRAIPAYNTRICICAAPSQQPERKIIQCSNAACAVRWWHYECLDKRAKLQVRWGRVVCAVCFNGEGFEREENREGEEEQMFEKVDVKDNLPGVGGHEVRVRPYGLGVDEDGDGYGSEEVKMREGGREGVLGELGFFGYAVSRPEAVSQAYSIEEVDGKTVNDEHRERKRRQIRWLLN